MEDTALRKTHNVASPMYWSKESFKQYQARRTKYAGEAAFTEV